METFLENVPGTDFSSFPKPAEPVPFTTDVLAFYNSVASVYSSKIEGEDIELDSYIKHRFLQGNFQKNYTKRVDDLNAAYDFAKANSLTFNNLCKAHALLTKNLLSASGRGKIRVKPEFIIDSNGMIEYVAAPPGIVKSETEKLFSDIETLLKTELSAGESFYFAGMAHLVFLKIHPFEDGNGRTSRMLEKWFLAEKFGPNAWAATTEKFYHAHKPEYYQAVHIGIDYESLDYGRCARLLKMLVKAVFDVPETNTALTL